MNEASFFEWARERLGSGRIFDDNQRQAIRAGAGPVLIEAGPGSGKTTVMTWRVLYLLRVKAVRGELSAARNRMQRPEEYEPESVGRGTVKNVARDKGVIVISFDGEEKRLGLDFCIVNPVLKRLA